jgi:hypothetical protein
MLHRFFVVLTVLALTAPAFASERGLAAAAESVPTAQAQTPSKAPLSARATSAERSRYAAREAASPEAKQYRGGADVVIISASALAVIVLAVVLLVVLL